jgi:hypothetical protein
MGLPFFPTLPGLTYTSLKTPQFDTEVMSVPSGYEVRIQQSINPVWTWTLVYDFLHDFFWGGYTAVSELRVLMGFFEQMGGKAQSFLFTDPDDNSVGPALSTAPWTANTSVLLGQGILDSANHWQEVTTPGITGSTVPTFNHSGGTTSDGSAVRTDEGLYSSSGFPNTFLAGLSLVTDGVGNWYSPIQRTLDGVFFEDVTDLMPGAPAPPAEPPIVVCANAILQSQGSLPGRYQVLGPGLTTPTRTYMGLYLQWVQAFHFWAASHPLPLNFEILDGAGHIQKVTTAGFSGTIIPTFNDSGGTTADGTGAWTDQGYNPAPVTNVTAEFNFYFRVRFDQESIDFEKFVGTGSASAFPPAGQGGGIYTIGGSESQQGNGTVRLTTARPVPLRS